MKKKKYALVLSGGGFLGAFQLGAINYINENWNKITGRSGKMKFDIVAGVSAGSINGSMVAMNQLDLLNELWQKIATNGASEIYTSDFIDVHDKGDDLKMKLNLEGIVKKLIPDFKVNLGLLKQIKLLFSKKQRKTVVKNLLQDLGKQLKGGLSNFKSIADNTPLKLKLKSYLDKNVITDTEFICGFVSLDTGIYHSVAHSDFRTNEDFVNGVVASTCMPVIWEPIKEVRFNKSLKLFHSPNSIDGGVRNISPLGDVVKRINNDPDSEYKIIIINCHNGVNQVKEFKDKNIAQIAVRSLYEIAFAEIFNNDLKLFLKTNDLVNQAKAWDKEIVLFDAKKTPLKSFDAVVLQPEDDFDLGNALVSNEKLFNLRMGHGKLVVEKALKKGGLK